MRPRRRITIALGLALIGPALAATAPAGSDEAPRCLGEVATIVGTTGDDVLRGTEEPDVIWAGPGDDTIHGGRGNDLICGGAGDDVIWGGRGNDRVNAGGGEDRVYGGLGDDKLNGGPGDRDEVGGGLGIDLVSGGPGDEDLVHGDYGWDRMDGGPGRGDIASFATNVAGGRGAGVWASLKAGKARGDGRDKLFRFDGIQGSAFADTLIGDKGANLLDGGPGDDDIRGGGGGRDTLIGGQGSDRCKGGPTRSSCGRERAPNASAYVEIVGAPGGGGGLAFVGGDGRDAITVAFDEAAGAFSLTAAKGIALGEGCTRPGADPTRAVCDPAGAARWLMADLGPGNDRVRLEGSFAGVGQIRLAGGLGDDVLRGSPEDDLIEAGRGADRLYGGAGEDGLIGGLPGPTYIYGGADGDLLAAGGGCAGGAIVGGGGRDNASFAETQGHPGLLYISLRHHKAWIDEVRRCRPVRLHRSIEDIEGSFDWDVLIGDGGDNNLLGQPGRDRFYGGGGNDVIDARDGGRDFVIQCARGGGRTEGRALVDRSDPAPRGCAKTKVGRPAHHLTG
jgi:Ca2+-binding RTX toxin-like protein